MCLFFADTILAPMDSKRRHLYERLMRSRLDFSRSLPPEVPMLDVKLARGLSGFVLTAV